MTTVILQIGRLAFKATKKIFTFQQTASGLTQMITLPLSLLSFDLTVLLQLEKKAIVHEDQIQSTGNMDLGFIGFKMELKGKKKKKENRLILDGSIRGRARPGRMLAIMGPSGMWSFR